MKKKTNNTYLYLAIGVVLLIVISFYYLTDFSTYWKQPAVQTEKQIGNTTFVLLDYEQCPSQCTHMSPCENVYLYSVELAEEKTLYQFLKEFKPFNGCTSRILFQTGNTVSEGWRAAISAKPNEVKFNEAYFALSYNDNSGFSIVDLANGKANGKFKKYDSTGNLFIEQELVNNTSEGKRIVYHQDYRIEQVWQNNTLVSEDTIK
ncbi:hypothetical protein POKO110462_22430 [Pontibacter korlensis]|uniref:Uncharacterized protein n=1 Tax=Pontibacter korlensis TaxID=400092 RepID=A0A0E3UX57_9BACT|nr:hypothetical protein [Pontibacter korlensis]AKD03301.1 hypothetical protein PKOR_09415 [Pontibacter korlensis]